MASCGSYSATASNKATNYYEVDLEEAIAATDQITALKYWWLLFRASAFTGFLDTLLTESDKYAKELGERLKDDVFFNLPTVRQRLHRQHAGAGGLTKQILTSTWFFPAR